MLVQDALRRSGVGVAPDAAIFIAAGVMAASGVGALAVIDAGRLVGVVTDRDLVRRGLARRVPETARVDSVMSAPPATIPATADLDDAYVAFRSAGVRRLAVVNDQGHFQGMLTVDDLLVRVAANLRDVTRPVASEVKAPHRDTSFPPVIDSAGASLRQPFVTS
jgi:CBS domain-containing protein